MLSQSQIPHHILRIISVLRAEKYQAYIVGGAVRDLLLGHSPKDYDIVSNATPKQIRKTFGKRARIIGHRFQLVHIYSRKGVTEVSTFRKKPNGNKSPGRKNHGIIWQDNSFGTIEKDVIRRDFTVNALYYDPFQKKKAILDYIGGCSDIENRWVRAIGNPHEKIAEDPIRMVRACKLMGQHAFRMEEILESEIINCATKLSLSSRTRLFEEFFKIIESPYSHNILQYCYQFGLLEHMLPYLSRSWTTNLGVQCQNLLQERDMKVKQGKILPSRLSGISAIVFPFFYRNWEEIKNNQVISFTSQRTAILSRFHGLVKDFFYPHVLPKKFSFELKTIFFLRLRVINSS